MELRPLIPGLFRTARAFITRFWAAAPGAIKDHLNTQELTRVAITSLSAGGGLLGVIEAVNAQAGSVFPASADAALATAAR